LPTDTDAGCEPSSAIAGGRPTSAVSTHFRDFRGFKRVCRTPLLVTDRRSIGKERLDFGLGAADEKDDDNCGEGS
jgi:hypothetical protein